MPFTLDRDLIVLHPPLFRELAFASQTLYRGTVKVVAGQLVPVTGSFPATIQPGHVAQFGDTLLEITAAVGSTSLSVSLPRTSETAPVIVPIDSGNTSGVVSTFDPQIAVVHAQILRMLGLEPAQLAINSAAPGESAVLNPRDLTLVEALGVLHLIYSSAAAPLGDGGTLAARAEHFRDRFVQERWRARAIIDTDGDGRADAVRAMSIAQLRRQT